MRSVRTIMDRGLLITTAALIALMAMGAIWQVFSRYVLNAPNSYTGELVKFGLVWATMLSASYAFGTNQHLSFTIFRDRFPDGRRRILLAVNSFVVIAFAVSVLMVGGVDLMSVTSDENTPVLLISRSLVNLSLPVAGVIIVVYQLMELGSVFGDREDANRESSAGTPTDGGAS